MIKRELGFFVANGIVAAAISYGAYRGLVSTGMRIDMASAMAYVAGMAYGYFTNRSLAFRDCSSHSTGKMARYGLLHVCTLSLNVGVNSAVLGAIRGMRGDLLTAFVIAISLSAASNFLGLKYWVFRPAASMSKLRNVMRRLASRQSMP